MSEIPEDVDINEDDLEITVRIEKNDLAGVAGENIIGYKLVSIDGVDAYYLHEGINGIGRMKRGNDISIKDKYASAIHAEIENIDALLTITDLGSTNGTFVNGVRVPAGTSQMIVSGDEIAIGHQVFRIEAIKE